MPSGSLGNISVVDNRDGTVGLKYEPKEEGLHEVAIKVNNEHVTGSPYKINVDSIPTGYVSAHGQGLIKGVCGEPMRFSISTKGAGATGGLAVAVEGPSKAEINCVDNKDGTVSVSYLPTAPGEYKVSIRFDDKHIKGSPFSVKITGEGRRRAQITLGTSNEISLKVMEKDIKNLNSSIVAPSGLEEPCFVKNLKSGQLGLSFTPREAGEHLVNVKRSGNHIKNSPFKIQVDPEKVGDARKVKVTGLAEGKTHVENKFTIDDREAGYGGVSVSIEGPSKCLLEAKDNEEGILNVTYKPTEPGYYIVNIKFADQLVEGSPFTVKVSGEGSNLHTERIKRQREAVPLVEIGNACQHIFKLPGVLPIDLRASMTTPSGVTEDEELIEIEDYLYAVNFSPKEVGVHTISVRSKEIHIHGSPFQFTVGPLRDTGAHRVHTGGPGLERGEVNQPSVFNVWTREAGAGSLSVSVEGPSKATIDFVERADGCCEISYKVTESGEYRVGIKYNDQNVPDSPYRLYVTPEMKDARKIELHQVPDSGTLNKPFSFIMMLNGARGQLEAKVVAPGGGEDDCYLNCIDEDEYMVRFVPRENGVHDVHLKFNGVHIPSSPLRIRVGKEEGDPAAVLAEGTGLVEGKSGQKSDFIIDTCNAGAGTMTVTIDGTSKVAMDCTEVDQGYKVRYTPLAPGDYYVTVKYNSYHIVGSPFKVTVTGEAVADVASQESSSLNVETVSKMGKKAAGPVIPRFTSDPTKITCKGMGLKRAYLNKQNAFTVDCKDAGFNLLYVGVIGPKNPCDEVFVKHQGHDSYMINYLVKDRGEYIVLVRYGEDHIPGSPFRVEV